jgi:hypothetical protein
MSGECLALLRGLDLPVRFIRGNCEDELLAEVAGTESRVHSEEVRERMRWWARQLLPEQVAALAAWPLALRFPIEGLGDVLFCHATPRDDNAIFTRLTPEDRLIPVFAEAGAPFVVCGHTHMQFDRMIGGTRVVNAGSVGMPFGEPGAYWLSLGPEVALRRTAYDLAQAAERIRGAPYPQARTFAEQDLLQPPSEAEILAEFAHTAT